MITMRTRKLIIWLSLILLGVPITVGLLNDISLLIDNIKLLAAGLLILSLLITGWKLKRGLKRRMEQGLGREVQDDELTSIATWMKVPEQASKAAREAERYDFSD
jgi:hypothetical protein